MSITSARMLRFNRQFGQVYAGRFAAFLDRTGLAIQEVYVLQFLLNNPELDTARDVAEYRGLAKSQVSQAVEQLAKRGLLGRVSDSADRRVVHLSITPEGVPLAEEARTLQNECLALLLRGLTDAEQTQFFGLLEKVFANMEALAEKENRTI